MATVRLTQDVRNEINRAASALFAKRRAEADRFFMDKAEIGRMVYEAWLDDRPAGTREALALVSDFLRTDDDIYIGRIGQIDIRENVTRDVYVPQVSTMIGATYGAAWNDPAQAYHVDTPELRAIAERWVKWEQERLATAAEASVFTTKVEAFLNRHVTLKAALAEWPQLWELVPQHLRAQHNEVTVRPAAKAKAGRDADPFDTSDMTGAIVSAKIVNSFLP